MAAGAVQSFGPWAARSPRKESPASSMALPDALHDNKQAQSVESEPDKKSKMQSLGRSKTSPEFILAPNKNGGQGGRHDPKAQRERMNMFKRQLAANRTRGTEEVMRRNKALSVQQRTAQESPNSFVTRSMLHRNFPMLRGGDVFLNQSDELTMEDMMCRGFSQWFSDNFSVNSGSQQGSRPGGGPADTAGGATTTTTTTTINDNNSNKKQDPELSVQKDSGSNVVELPDILPEQNKRRINGSQPACAPSSLSTTNNNSNNNNNKKIHFAEGLPFIKGSSIAAWQSKPEPERHTENARPETTPSATKSGAVDPHSHADMLQPPWSAPVTSRSLTTMTPRSKMFKPMPIPKIDIVSEIYDELIVKTIQSFLEREGYSSERFSKLRDNIMARLSPTYPHLARHRAWKLVRKDAADGVKAAEAEERRLRLRPLHQGFFATHPALEVDADFTREGDAFLGHLPQGSRHPNDQIRPRWVPVIPTYRPSTREEERYASSMFMSVDGRHIAFTPRDDLHFKTATLPGATSDYRMAPLVIRDDTRPMKTWTHIIPSAADE